MFPEDPSGSQMERGFERGEVGEGGRNGNLIDSGLGPDQGGREKGPGSRHTWGT